MTMRNGPAADQADQTVVLADPSDLDVLSQVIADAFHDLAPSRWLITDPAARRQIFPGYFRLHLEHGMASGIVHTTPGRTAAALWIPTGENVAGQATDYDARLAAATNPWTSQFAAFDAVLDRHHPADIPHYYLAMLAVRPDRQGRGTGTALLRTFHAALDQAGTPAYLEASGPRTRHLYLSHGYTDHGPSVHLPGGPDMYPMWRPAKSHIPSELADGRADMT
jgi:GNAT superfamily N-acetyltransferase